MKNKKLLILLTTATLTFSGCSIFNKDVEIKKEQKVEETSNKITTSTGLSYEVLQEGSGTLAQKGHTVSVHYTGWLTDMTKFDSSVDRGRPFSFKLGQNRVIRGWEEGVEGMKIGEKRRLYIPSKLGYGSRGAGKVIPPNADLIFDVELLGVK